MSGPIPDAQLSRLVHKITGNQTHVQRHLEVKREQRIKKFIRDIPKNFVTREEYEQMVLVVNELVDKVNNLSPSVPSPSTTKE